MWHGTFHAGLLPESVDERASAEGACSPEAQWSTWLQKATSTLPREEGKWHHCPTTEGHTSCKGVWETRSLFRWPRARQALLLLREDKPREEQELPRWPQEPGRA